MDGSDKSSISCSQTVVEAEVISKLRSSKTEKISVPGNWNQ